MHKDGELGRSGEKPEVNNVHLQQTVWIIGEKIS